MVKIRQYSELLFFKFIDLFVFLLPRKLCLAAGKLLGHAVYRFDKKHRSLALSNLQAAFGSGLSNEERKKCAKGAFENFGKVFLDILKLSNLPREKAEKTFTVSGEENLIKALQQGKGVLIFTAHYGNWEIGPLYLSRFGKLKVIARPMDNRLLEKKLLKIRNKFGAHVIYKHRASREILRALSAKDMVAILIDQNVLRDQAVFVDFFGRKAATTPGLASLYLKTRAPLLPMFGYPSPSGTYLIKVFEPIEISPSRDQSKDVLKITQLCTNIIEDQIRQFPHNWFWFHDRWRTRPEGE